jgi:hypothetical protein
MSPAETHLIDTAKRYTAICVQVSQAYTAEQAKLKLDQILTFGRLSSLAGTRVSLEALDQLSTLTSAHKAAMEKIFLSGTTDLTAAMADLPESLQARYREGILKSLHGHLAAQSQFYENRGKWINAARNLCKLVDTQRESARFEAETIVFEKETDQERFETLLGTVEEFHSKEVALMKQVLDRFNQSTSLLGLNSQ